MVLNVKQLTSEARSELAAKCVADYNLGYTMRQVADRHGLSLGTARRLLLEGGVVWREGLAARRRKFK